MSARSSRRGFALMTALGLAAVLGVLAWTFQSAMRFHWTVAQTTSWETQASYLAQAGLAEAQAALTAGEDLAPLWTFHAVGEDGLVRVSVTSASARLHLNLASAAEVARLLNIPEDTVDEGRPLADVHDALRAWSLSPDQFDLAVVYGTVVGSGGIDFNAAPQEVLAALDGVSSEMAAAIVSYRDTASGSMNTAAALAAVPAIDSTTARQLAGRIARDDDAWRHAVAEGRIEHGAKRRRTARLSVVFHREETEWQVAGPVGWTPAW